MRCIICSQNKIKFSPVMEKEKEFSEEDAIFDVTITKLKDKEQKEFYQNDKIITNANNRMWHGGIVHIIDAGYGSTHDTDKFVIGICDQCITDKQEEGLLLYHSNYMSEEYGIDSKEKSRLLYRRNNNLDNLTS